MGRRRLVALWIAVVLVAAAGVHATEITGPHNNQGLDDGYDATSGAYDVPADSGGVPSATFNENGNDGLLAAGSGTSVTVEGGQFDANFTSGIEAETSAMITITGGAFDSNGDEAVTADRSSVITISGGQFADNHYGLYADGGTIDLYGGQFSGNTSADFVIGGGILNVYGAFAGVADGQTVTLQYSNSGSFYGELGDNSAAQTYTYAFGTVTLHGTGTLAPEPTTVGLTAVAAATVLARRRRRGS